MFLCWGKISQLGEKRKASVTHRKDFLEKNGPKYQILKICFLKLSDLGNRFQHVIKIIYQGS
jgi:hypothetical protein